MLEYYINKFVEQLQFCKEEEFTGNITFQINFNKGYIGNMMVDVKKSFKHDKEEN